MFSEFIIPLWYTIRRDMLRHDHKFLTSLIAFGSSMLRDYIWVPIYIFFIVGVPNQFQLTGIFLHLIAFSIAYEIGYIFTDNISIKYENKNIRHVVYEEPVPERTVYFSILIRLLILAIMLWLMDAWMSRIIFISYISLLGIYFIYGLLSEKLRVPLFVLLRYLKGFVPYAFLILHLPKYHLILVSIVLMATAIFYSIEYGTRKLELPYINIQKLRYLWLRYFIILLFIVPYSYFSKTSLANSALLFFIYMGIHICMIVFSLSRKLLVKYRSRNLIS